MSSIVNQRGWLRFSLRGMLIAITAIAVWLAINVNRARTQRNAVEQIQAAGGTVVYDFQEVSPRHWSTVTSPNGPEWARRFLGTEYFDRPNRVNVSNPADERWAEAMRELTTIKYLLLSGKHVTDSTLNRLGTLANLWEVQLTDTSISDDGLKFLRPFSRLKWLTIYNADVTDEGVRQIAGIESLEELRFSKCKLTDRSVAHLSSLHHFQQLHIRGGALSADGIEQLKTALPHCLVFYSAK